MDREQLVEVMAEALWDGFVERHLHPAYWPSWGELLAQGHQGMHRVDEFRAYARAALAVAEPVVREWERESTPGTVRIEQTIQGDTVSTRFDTSNLSLDDALAAVAKARDSLTTELDLAVSCPMHTALRSRTGVAP